MTEAIVMLIGIGLIGGIAVGLQAPLASLISQRAGVLESVFIVHLGGALVALIPLLVAGGGHLPEWRRVPPYALGAGAFGLVVIASISYTMPRIGVAAGLTLVIAGQLVIGVLLDHFGLLGAAIRPFTMLRLAGLAVLCLGVWMIIR